MNNLQEVFEEFLVRLYCFAAYVIVSAIGLAAGLILVPLRLAVVVDWSWWLVLAPLAPAAILAGLILVGWLHETWGRLLTLALTLALATQAPAGEFYYPRRYYQPRPLVQQFQAYYVGAPIRVAAMVRAELESSPEFQAFQEFKQFRAEFEAWRESQGAGVPPGSPPVEKSAMRRSCVRCHSGPQPKGGLDLTAPLSVESIKKLKQKILEDAMPPPDSPERKQWDEAAAGAVLSDAVDALNHAK